MLKCLKRYRKPITEAEYEWFVERMCERLINIQRAKMDMAVRESLQYAKITPGTGFADYNSQTYCTVNFQLTFCFGDVVEVIGGARRKGQTLPKRLPKTFWKDPPKLAEPSK